MALGLGQRGTLLLRLDVLPGFRQLPLISRALPSTEMRWDSGWCLEGLGWCHSADMGLNWDSLSFRGLWL